MNRNAVAVRDKPYLFNYYDVEHKLPPNFDTTSKISRMRSVVVHAINGVKRMPKLL